MEPSPERRRTATDGVAVTCIWNELSLETLDNFRGEDSRTDHLAVPSDTAEGMALIDPEEKWLAAPLCFGPCLDEVQPPGDLEPALFLRRGQNGSDSGVERVGQSRIRKLRYQENRQSRVRSRGHDLLHRRLGVGMKQAIDSPEN
jgi:hypothetical protein